MFTFDVNCVPFKPDVHSDVAAEISARSRWNIAQRRTGGVKTAAHVVTVRMEIANQVFFQVMMWKLQVVVEVCCLLLGTQVSRKVIVSMLVFLAILEIVNQVFFQVMMWKLEVAVFSIVLK